MHDVMIERTASQLLHSLASGEISSEALTDAFLQAIQQRDSKVKAYLLLDEEGARTQARSVDARRQRGEKLGLLAGIPVAVKDILCWAGQPTTCGSKMLRDYKPPYDAHVVARLRQADAVLIGKLNMDEFAMGSSTETSAFQITCNPWDLTRTPGGSSGGSAAAVAACIAPLTIGTDTGGSIRQPAGHCGVVGLKPTYGRVSRFGLIAFASSLDQVGPIAHDVTDAALLLEAIAGHDPRDSTSVPKPVPPYRETLGLPVTPLTIGVAKEYFGAGLDPEVEASVRAALAVYEKLGAKIEEVSLPNSPHAVAVYYVVATAEASSNLARYDGVHFGHRSKQHANLIDMVQRSRGEGFGSEVKCRILLGTYVLSSGYKDALYVQALKVRRLIRDDFDKVFSACDVLIGPTSPTPAFVLGERSDDPLAMYLSDIYTISANLAGIPGVSIPCGFSKTGLPIGLQIQAPPFAEEKLLRIARMYERATEWHTRRAPSFA